MKRNLSLNDANHNGKRSCAQDTDDDFLDDSDSTEFTEVLPKRNKKHRATGSSQPNQSSQRLQNETRQNMRNLLYDDAISSAIAKSQNPTINKTIMSKSDNQTAEDFQPTVQELNHVRTEVEKLSKQVKGLTDSQTALNISQMKCKICELNASSYKTNCHQ